MLSSIFENHKICLNRSNENFAMERRFGVQLHSSFNNVKILYNAPLKSPKSYFQHYRYLKNTSFITFLYMISS